MVSSWSRSSAHGARWPTALFLSSIKPVKPPFSKAPPQSRGTAIAAAHSSSFDRNELHPATSRSKALDRSADKSPTLIAAGASAVTFRMQPAGCVRSWSSSCRGEEGVMSKFCPPEHPVAGAAGGTVGRRSRCNSFGSAVRDRRSARQDGGVALHVIGGGCGAWDTRGRASAVVRDCQVQQHPPTRRCYSSQDDFGGGQHFPHSDQVWMTSSSSTLVHGVLCCCSSGRYGATSINVAVPQLRPAARFCCGSNAFWLSAKWKRPLLLRSCCTATHCV